MENRLYIEVTNDIEDQIRSGTLMENEKLPSERKLALQYGVSRNVVREALRVLHEKGLVISRNNSGCYVREPEKDELIHRFEQLMISSKVPLEELLDARLVIETAVAKKVIDTVMDENIYELKAIYLKMEYAVKDGQRYMELDGQFHLKLAEIANNQILTLIMSALNQLSDRESYLKPTEPSVILHAQKEHAEMIASIEERNLERYIQAIQKHLECIRMNTR